MKFLDHLEEWLIAFLMGAATLLIFVAVVHRYAAGLPIPGVQDTLLVCATSQVNVAPSVPTMAVKTAPASSPNST